MGKKSVERNVRLEKLRREQQRKERRRALLIYGTSGLVALVLLVGIILYIWLDNRGKGESRKVGYVAAPTAAATAASCTGVVNDAFGGNTHVQQPVDYPASPPSSGNHWVNPLPDTYRFYEPTSQVPVERAVHNLEHGFVVAWYDPDLPADQIQKLRDIPADFSDRYIAVPWTRGSFADGKHFVLTAWDRTQRCGTVSVDAIKEFVTTYSNPSPDGVTWDSPTAPESGAAGGANDITPDGPIPTSDPTATAPAATP